MVDLGYPVCGVCGVAVVRGTEKWLHIESLPEKTEEHEAADITSRRDYLFGKQSQQTGGDLLVQATERQAFALERIAASLEQIIALLAGRSR